MQGKRIVLASGTALVLTLPFPSTVLASGQSLKQEVTIANLQTSEDKVLAKLKEARESIENLFTKENVTNLKDKILENYKLIVDFVIYDGKINGVSFSELSVKTQAEILKIVVDLDEAITRYFPHYKEDWVNAYQTLGEDFQLFFSKVDQRLASWLGPDYSEKIKSFGQNLVDIGYKIFDDTKSNIKDAFDKLEKWFKK